jgi:hypothetical protein
MRAVSSLMAALAAVVLAAVAAAVPASAALPQVDYRLTGDLGADGWYVGPVTLEWTVTNALSTSGCDKRYLTADTGGVQFTCTAVNDSGTIPATTSAIRIDRTPPANVTAAASRPPDAGGWYTRPVDLAWSGTDALSGIESCTTLSYAGPDTAAAAPPGACRDRAGNVSATVPFTLAYDATAPAVSDVVATFDGATATLRWNAGADTDHVTVVRQPAAGAGAAAHTVLDGGGTARQLTDRGLRRGGTYTWTVTVRDVAGNTAAVSATATVPKPPGPPVLRWRAVTQAKYYNVQLFRGGRKILSAWPSHARFRLPRAWRFHGRRHRLIPGTYRWYVWPGYGPRATRHYGKLRGHGELRVR